MDSSRLFSLEGWLRSVATRRDPKEHPSFPGYDTAVFDTALNHIRVYLCYSYRHQPVSTLAELLVYIGGNHCPMYDFCKQIHGAKADL